MFKKVWFFPILVVSFIVIGSPLTKADLVLDSFFDDKDSFISKWTWEFNGGANVGWETAQIEHAGVYWTVEMKGFANSNLFFSGVHRIARHGEDPMRDTVTFGHAAWGRNSKYPIAHGNHFDFYNMKAVFDLNDGSPITKITMSATHGVPEPSTLGVIGVCAICASIFNRRRKPIVFRDRE